MNGRNLGLVFNNHKGRLKTACGFFRRPLLSKNGITKSASLPYSATPDCSTPHQMYKTARPDYR